MKATVIKEVYEKGKKYIVGKTIDNLSKEDYERLKGKNLNRTQYITDYVEPKEDKKSKETNKDG